MVILRFGELVEYDFIPKNFQDEDGFVKIQEKRNKKKEIRIRKRGVRREKDLAERKAKREEGDEIGNKEIG
jgi:hypothetical protein